MASEENAGIHDLVINAKSKKDNSTIYNHGTDYLPWYRLQFMLRYPLV